MAKKLDPDILHTSEYEVSPETVWRQLRHEQPCFYDIASNMYVLTRYVDVAQIFADRDTYSAVTYESLTGAVLGPTLISRDDEGHDQRRRLVGPEFTGRRLVEYQQIIQRCSNHLIDQFSGTIQVDLIRQFTRRLPVDVISEILGMRGDGDLFRDWVSTMIHGLDPEFHEQGQEAYRMFCSHISPLLEHVQDVGRSDLIARIARGKIDGENLSNQEILAFCGLIFIAGGETTDKAMGNMWWNLLHHRDQLDALMSDSSLWDAAFSETMRRTAPVVSEDRLTTRDVSWHGVTIPAGSVVSACIGSANLDESIFSAPEHFNLFREDLHLGRELRNGRSSEQCRSGHLGFGLGKHFCLGLELARSEAILGSQLLVERCGIPEFAPAAANSRLMLIRSMRSVAPDLPIIFRSR